MDWVIFFGMLNYMNCDYFGQNFVILFVFYSGIGLFFCVWFDSDFILFNVMWEYLVYLFEVLFCFECYYGVFWIYILFFQVII